MTAPNWATAKPVSPPVAPASSDVDQLFREKAGEIADQLRRRASDSETVWDAVQEAFARFAALAPSRRRSIDRPDAFLFRMGANLLIDWARRSRPSEVLSKHSELTGPDPVLALESRERLRRLERALATLKPKTREIFLAHRLDGLSYAEIAKRTGLSVKGVEKQMSKAIATLDRLAGDR